ncbi:hypothetical protein [Bacteroides sp.]|uniref:hypothetical protein n=1 Tax=Bacteroides sp. TaxID=29523 RepID=UPI002626A51E|nr:hypothetical protein [Bacteroides sp.]
MLTLGDDDLPIGRRKKGNYMSIGGVLHKRCSHCGQFFRLNYFYPLKYTRNGKRFETLQSWCKFCTITENCRRVKEKSKIN